MKSQTPESLQTLELSINPQLFLDVLLLEIRRETPSTCKVQSARSCTFAFMQDFTFLHIITRKDLDIIHSSLPTYNVLSTISRIFANMHIKSVQVPRNSVCITPYKQGAHCKILQI